MSNPGLTKLRKQPDSIWALLQKRLIAVPDPVQKLIEPEVWTFIVNKSHSLITNVGYVSTSIMATTAFITRPASTCSTETQVPLSFYSIFVGQPTKGKFQAIKKCAVSSMVAVFGETD